MIRLVAAAICVFSNGICAAQQWTFKNTIEANDYIIAFLQAREQSMMFGIQDRKASVLEMQDSLMAGFVQSALPTGKYGETCIDAISSLRGVNIVLSLFDRLDDENMRKTKQMMPNMAKEITKEADGLIAEYRKKLEACEQSASGPMKIRHLPDTSSDLMR
jgi:hypothetical protein